MGIGNAEDSFNTGDHIDAGLGRRGYCAEFSAPKKHVHRFAIEYEFLYDIRSADGVEDWEGARLALHGIIKKRLT